MNMVITEAAVRNRVAHGGGRLIVAELSDGCVSAAVVHPEAGFCVVVDSGKPEAWAQARAMLAELPEGSR